MKKRKISITSLALSLILTLTLLTGCGEPTVASTAIIEDDIQIVNSGIYEAITVQKGIPVKWTINADENDLSSCNTTMIIPEYGIEKELLAGENVIEFTPDESGVIPYSCWMGMVTSEINVVDSLTADLN